MELRDLQECPVYPNLQPLAPTRARLRRPSDVERQMRWDYFCVL